MLGLRVAAAAAAPGVRQLHRLPVTTRGPGGRSSHSGIDATVFGATGFVGRYVVNKLAGCGSQVVVPFRGDEHDVRFLRPMGDIGKVIFQPYGILDADSVAESVKYSNVVINCAGQSYKSRHYTMEDVNVDGARNVARAAKQAGATRLVHVSALGAAHDSPSQFLRSKAAGEAAVLEEFPEATIVRPAVLFGAEDRFLNRLGNLNRFPFFIPLPNGGETIKQPVWGLDVAQGIVNSLDDPHAMGQVYECVGPRQYTTRELVEYVNEAIRKPRMVVGYPEIANPGFLLAARMVGIARLKSLPRVAELETFMLDDEVSDGAYGLEDLGVTPVPLEQKALSVLRRFRLHTTHDEIVDFDTK